MDRSNVQRIVLLVMLAMAAACSSFGESDSSTANSKPAGKSAVTPATKAGLIPQRTPPVADLPVPLGFKLVESMSRSYESAGSRYVDHTYDGRENKVDVDQFYRQQMPNKGWTMRGSQMVRGVYIHRYEKGNELADVNISGDDNPILGVSSRVNINVQTVGRGEPKR